MFCCHDLKLQLSFKGTQKWSVISKYSKKGEPLTPKNSKNPLNLIEDEKMPQSREGSMQGSNRAGRFFPRGSAGISRRKSSKLTGNINQNLNN